MRLLEMYILGCLFALISIAGCGSGCGQVTTAEMGALELPLHATSTGGHEYRLVDGEFVIRGKYQTRFSSNDYLDEEAAVIELPAGVYTIELKNGWKLEQWNEGDWSEVANAELTSEKKQAFTIKDNHTTSVTFQFRLPGDIIALGGALSVSIEVDDSGAGGAPPSGLILWNKLGSEEELTNSEIGIDGHRLSHPNDANQSSATYGQGRFGGGIVRSRVEDISTPNEFFHFGTSADNHSQVSINRGCVEFWWKAVDFGEWVFGYWLNASASEDAREDRYVAPMVSLHWNSWDYGEGNLRTVGGTVGYHDGSVVQVELETPFSASFVPGTWYHLALTWDVDGIPDDPDGHRLAIYLDGAKWSRVVTRDDLVVDDNDHYISSLWLGTRPTDYASGGSAYYNLWGTYDNLKAWDYAKTDFSDRFTE